MTYIDCYLAPVPRENRAAYEELAQISAHVVKEYGALRVVECWLDPRKGIIAVGSDADLVLFDPTLTRTVRTTMLKSRADYSVYEGWQVTGWPVLTLRRGEIVFRDDEVVGQPGSGALVRRGSTQPLSPSS